VIVHDEDDRAAFVVAAAAAATRDETAFRSESSFCQPGFRSYVCVNGMYGGSARTVKNFDLRMS
jgi:hypothetical protein